MLFVLANFTYRKERYKNEKTNKYFNDFILYFIASSNY